MGIKFYRVENIYSSHTRCSDRSKSDVQFRWIQKGYTNSQPYWDVWGLDNVSITVVTTLTSATYDASSGTLVVTGANLEANSGALNDIDVSQLTFTGEGSNTYTLTSSDVEIDSATQFTITLNAADQLQLAGLLNKNGTTSGGSTTYNIAAASGWNPGASSSPADNTGNAITVSNVTAPTLTSATYNASTGAFTITGSNLPAYPGSSNDIDVSKLTITGGSGGTYTLTSTDVELTSATAFSITLNSTDRTNLDSLLNKNGTSSTQGTTYNITAADDWAPGADSSTDIADLNGNAITVSAVNNAPVLTTPTAGTITEDSDASTTTTSNLSGTLSASDADGDTLTYGITGGTVDSGTSTLAGTYGSLVINTTTGEYTYTPTSAAVEALCAGANTDSFSVTASDGTATKTSPYTVNITGADDSAVISGDVSGTGAEDTSAITGTLSATDVEGLADNTYFTVSTTPSQGTASIDAASGDWSYTPTANFNGSDSFTVTITDDCGGTTTQAIALTITAVNDAPITTSAGSILAFTEGDGATVIDSSLTITDADDSNIESATVSIFSGFQSAEDVLAFSNTSAISGSWNASTGVLTLTGSDTLANYKAALESVTYNNTSDNPNTTNRSISWVVNDGDTDSSAVTSTITVAAVNDAPVASGSPSLAAISEDSTDPGR